jgi:hypothetical protein
VSRRSTPAVCGRCGEQRPLAKRATAEHPDLCTRCYKAHQPRRPCGICGKTRAIRVRARDGQPDICNDCAPRRHAACGVCGRVGVLAVTATDDAPAIGRCCWRPAVATCTSCARERPCYHASGPDAVCLSCNRVRRVVTCLDCGDQRPANRRVTGGVICAPCDRRRANMSAICAGCRGTAPLGRELCDACRLRQRVTQLAAAGDRDAAAMLAPYLATLADAHNPASTLRWLQTPTLALLQALLGGQIAITHRALDVAAGDTNSGRAVGYIRAALVDTGVLEARDEHSAAFERWQQGAVDAVAAGPDRGHVRAYATWHVAHQLALLGEVAQANEPMFRAFLLKEELRLLYQLEEPALAPPHLVPGWRGHRDPGSRRSSGSPAPSAATATASSPRSASACPTGAWKDSTAASVSSATAASAFTAPRR